MKTLSGTIFQDVNNKKLLIRNTFRVAILSVLFLGTNTFKANCLNKPPHVVIGYIAGYDGLIDMNMIKSEKLTHLNYAFANIKNNRINLKNAATDTVNLKKLGTLKIKNPDLKILISIGGWTFSNNFSDMALADTSRKAFARSAVAFVEKYKLDGVDIDWEFPGLPGAGNIHRPEDKQNFTLLLKAFKEELNDAEKRIKKKLVLTIAADCSKDFLEHTEMYKAQAYLDYIDLMAYDFLNELPGKTCHQAPLFPSKTLNNNNSVLKSVQEYLKEGILPGKIVLGIPFYGHLYQLKSGARSVVGAELKSAAGTKGFTDIQDSLINSGKFQYHKDRTAKAAYLFSPQNQQFVTFEDEWSIRHKCKYVKDHRLAGVMFWEYSNDEKGILLQEINRKLKFR
ncbi:glycoside hydrolase family 18 protein [Pedobacter cryoconitis]|uniref:chitinase n=1 Tax=Pedobacter cryoconitis TaxID=188932 RepID=A0A327T271_9SPHI|nr:glycoside hydrolase family 18 protein [Pedobacter cryoconitis]RAJ35740.1 chitinase [Pedobacter cryoconitis]